MLVAALAAAVAVALRPTAALVRRRRQPPRPGAGAVARAGRRPVGAAGPADDARSGPLDHLGEPWAFPLPPTPIANGAIEGRIDDAQGRLNVNNLALDGKAGDGRARCASRVCLRAKASIAGIARRDRRLGRCRSTRARNGAEDACTRALAWRRGGERAAGARRRARRRARREPDSVGGARARRRRAARRDGAQRQHRDRRRARRRDSGSRRRQARGFIAERARKPFTTMAELRERLPRGVTLPRARRSALAAAISWSACARARATPLRRRARC